MARVAMTVSRRHEWFYRTAFLSGALQPIEEVAVQFGLPASTKFRVVECKAEPGVPFCEIVLEVVDPSQVSGEFFAPTLEAERLWSKFLAGRDSGDGT